MAARKRTPKGAKRRPPLLPSPRPSGSDPDRNDARRLWLTLGVILAGGLPVAWASFEYPAFMGAHVGPFGLVPLMVWPGLVVLAIERARGFPWRAPSIAGALAGLAYPLGVVAVTATLAIVLGAAPGPEPGELKRALAAWPKSLLASFAGALLPVLGEELAWRGFFQRKLAPRGEDAAMILTAAAATAFHGLALFSPPLRGAGLGGVASFLAAVFLLNLGAGAIFRVAGSSVWASFTFHVVWNATNPTFTSDIYGAMPGVIGGTPWVVSGEGAIGVAASLVCLPALWLWARRAGSNASPRVTVPRRARAAWALLLALLVVAGAFASRSPETERPPDAARMPVTKPGAGTAQLRTDVGRALDRGLAFLEANLETLSLDAVFLLRLIEGAWPSSRAGVLAERALPAAKRDPTYPLFQEIVTHARPPYPARTLDPTPVPGTPNPRQPFDEKFSDQCLRGALDCRWADGCEPYKKKLGQWGYVLTHQVLFFAFAHEKRCGEKMGIDPAAAIAALAPAMMKEQRADAEFSDLAVERIGLGAYVGYREFLRDEWIRNTLAAQRDPEGCWYWRKDEPVCSDHATGMALWVLAMWLGNAGGREQP